MSLLPTQGALDAFFDYTIQSDQSRFSIHPRFDRFGLRVLTILQFLAPNGSIRAFEYEGGDPGLVRLDPEWHQTAGTFATLGFRYVVNGIDSLLFLLCLVVPFRKLRQIVAIVGAFAAAHSVTFVASAFGMAPGVSWFPPLGHHARCDLDPLRGGATTSSGWRARADPAHPRFHGVG